MYNSSFFGGVESMEYPGGYGDSGTYSRFFLIPKAARADREPVLDREPEPEPGREPSPARRR